MSPKFRFYPPFVEAKVSHNQYVSVGESTINFSDLSTCVSTVEHGAQSIFLGMVRNVNQGKKVVAVSYDSFAPLAAVVIGKICDEAREKFDPELRVAVMHRTGRLLIGEISVAIVASTRHRDAAFECCQYVIEQLKVRAPIWKKEHYEDGETEWLKGHALCGHRKSGFGSTYRDSCRGQVEPNENRQGLTASK